MSSTAFGVLLAASAGGVLVCAVATLWQRSTGSVVGWLAAQGIFLSSAALWIGIHASDAVLMATAGVVLAVKGILVPRLLTRVVRVGGSTLASSPVVNVPASLVAAGALVFLASAAMRHVVDLVPDPAGRLVPIGLASFLIGFFTLVSRKHAVSQIVGILLIDNGIALFAFLVTSGVPILVEFGVSLDVLLVIVVLQVLTARMQAKFGALDVDQLQELHD